MTVSVQKSAEAPRHWLGPAEAMIAPIAVALLVAILVSLGVMGWWSIRAERTAIVAARTAHVVSTSQLLADSVHSMLSSGDVSGVRRLVAGAAQHNGLQICRVELPDGSILADQQVANTTLDTLPDNWVGGDSTGEVIQQYNDNALTLIYPIQVPGRGIVTLHIEAAAGATPQVSDMTIVVVAAVGGLTLIMVVLLYHPAKSRVVPYALIREALQSVQRGEVDPEALKVSDTLGPEARVWNQLVGHKEQIEHDQLLDKALDSVASQKSGAGSFGQIGDALWQGIILVDEGLQISYANGAAAVLLKSSRDAMVGSNVDDAFDEKVIEVLREVSQASDTRRRTIESDQDDEERGEVLRFSIRGTGESQSKTMLVVIEDITQQRVAETSRRNFVAQVAHELRTPLTNISLNVEAAVDDGEEDAELRGRCLNVITQETQRLTQLVNDMLSVSEIEAGSMSLRHDDIRLADVLAHLEADFKQQADDKQVGLIFDLPPKLPLIQGDRDKLAISLHNLLGNAIKYSPPGGEVTVSIMAEGGRLSFAFKDKGIGIEKEELEKVFDRFYRANDSRVSQITGTGLGLPIAREIVKRHGGDIEASSTLNQGSTFTINLPYKPEAA